MQYIEHLLIVFLKKLEPDQVSSRCTTADSTFFAEKMFPILRFINVGSFLQYQGVDEKKMRQKMDD